MHLAYRRPKVINQCPKQIEDDRLKFHLLMAGQNFYFAALTFGPFGVSSISYPACLICARRASASFHCFALRAFSRSSTSAEISSGMTSSVGCHSANRNPNTWSNCNSVAFLVARDKSSFTNSHTTASARHVQVLVDLLSEPVDVCRVGLSGLSPVMRGRAQTLPCGGRCTGRLPGEA